MGAVVSRVPELLQERGWGAMDLVRRANMGVGTAYKVAGGDTDFTIETLAKLCTLFGVPIQEVVTFVADEEQPG